MKYTYIACDNKRFPIYKVGSTEKPNQRKSGMKTASPFIDYEILIPFDVEKFLQSKFRKIHVRGEWYALDKRDLSVLEKCSKMEEYDFIKNMEKYFESNPELRFRSDFNHSFNEKITPPNNYRFGMEFKVMMVFSLFFYFLFAYQANERFKVQNLLTESEEISSSKMDYISELQFSIKKLEEMHDATIINHKLKTDSANYVLENNLAQKTEVDSIMILGGDFKNFYTHY